MSHRLPYPIRRPPLQVTLVFLGAFVPLVLASGVVLVARQSCSSAGTLACEPGQSGSQCHATVFEGSAFAYANRQSYGQADAHSTHQYRQGATTTNLESKDLTLNAGDPPEEPPDCGPGNLYNEWTGLCEINPDGPGSPIVIATGRASDYNMTSVAQGVLFDLNGDGVPEQIAWTPANTEVAFLAIDRDGDGRITSGKELFGNFTYPGVRNGFAALSRMNRETNGGVLRGSVNSDQPLFAKLLLWTDANHNGISEANELQPASALLSDIGLSYEDHRRKDGNGNEFRYRGWVHIRTAPGRNKAANLEEARVRLRYVYDVFFAGLK